MTTIRDVAQAAGVSRATAARVLSAPELVAEATRHRVLKAVQEVCQLVMVEEVML